MDSTAVRISVRLTAAIVLVCMGIFPVFASVTIADTSPTITLNATRGLSQTSSAEALGDGRLTVAAHGTWYQQAYRLIGVPAVGAHLITGIGAMSYGVNQHIDVFGSIAGFGTLNYTGEPSSGIGSLCGGIQGSLPFPSYAPLRLGGQLFIISGTAGNRFNTNDADGYDYLQMRIGYDFVGRLLQTLVFGNEGQSFKIHLNEGIDYSLESHKDALLLLAAALQANIHPYFVLGLEVNSRTFLKNISPRTDPLWLTPSIIFRMPFYTSFIIGGDISLSNARVGSAASQALEQYRIFGGFTFSFDLLKGKRIADAAALAEKERLAAAEKTALENKNSALIMAADSLVRKAKADSLALVQQQLESKRIADSLAVKAHNDSLILVDTKRRLEEEKSKRTDAEKQLLSTGLLLLDAVYFESGKIEISINSLPYLNIIAKMLVKYPKLQIEIQGHTDNVGGAVANLQLSQLRAESVRNYLAQVQPELGPRVFAHGYGLSMPKAPNSTAAGRKINRRVELQVLNKDVLREYNP